MGKLSIEKISKIVSQYLQWIPEFIPSINEDSKTDNEEPRNEPLTGLLLLDYESEEEQENTP